MIGVLKVRLVSDEVRFDFLLVRFLPILLLLEHLPLGNLHAICGEMLNAVIEEDLESVEDEAALPAQHVHEFVVDLGVFHEERQYSQLDFPENLGRFEDEKSKILLVFDHLLDAFYRRLVRLLLVDDVRHVRTVFFIRPDLENRLIVATAVR